MSNMLENDVAGLAVEKAALLRMLQVGMADQPESARAASLRDALDEMVAAVPAERRQAFLGELSRRFPTWDRPTGAAAPARSPAGPSPAAAASPVSLVDQLCRAAPSLSPEARAEVARRLAAAGLAAPAQSSSPAAATGGGSGNDASGETLLGPLRDLLNIEPGRPLDPVRVGQLVRQVMELVTLSDPLVWGMWQNKIARGDNAIACRGRAKEEAKAWLTGGGDGRTNLMQLIITDLQRLVVAMGCTLADTPPQVDTAVRSRLDPAQFERAIAIGGYQHTSIAGGNRRETECWRLFVAAYGAIAQAGGFEAVAQELIAETVRNYFHGDGHGGG